MLNLLSRCDAEASGASAAVITWEKVTDKKSESVSLCQHHNDQHAAKLKADGFAPFAPTTGEQTTTSAERFVTT